MGLVEPEHARALQVIPVPSSKAVVVHELFLDDIHRLLLGVSLLLRQVIVEHSLGHEVPVLHSPVETLEQRRILGDDEVLECRLCGSRKPVSSLLEEFRELPLPDGLILLSEALRDRAELKPGFLRVRSMTALRTDDVLGSSKKPDQSLDFSSRVLTSVRF